jgi:hypothetical protein
LGCLVVNPKNWANPDRLSTGGRPYATAFGYLWFLSYKESSNKGVIENQHQPHQKLTIFWF